MTLKNGTKYVYIRTLAKVAKRVEEKVKKIVGNGRLDRKRLWELNSFRIELRMMQGEKWLRRINRLKETDIDLDKGGVYILCNSQNRYVYIGETKSFRRRHGEHIYAAQTGKKEKLIVSLKRESVDEWVMVSLQQVEEEEERKKEERRWAHIFRGRLLNDIGSRGWQNQKNGEKRVNRKRPTRNYDRLSDIQAKRRGRIGGGLKLTEVVKLCSTFNEYENGERVAEAVNNLHMPEKLRERLRKETIMRLKELNWIKEDALVLNTIAATVGRSEVRGELGKNVKTEMMKLWSKEVKIKQKSLLRLKDVCDGGKEVWENM